VKHAWQHQGLRQQIQGELLLVCLTPDAAAAAAAAAAAQSIGTSTSFVHPSGCYSIDSELSFCLLPRCPLHG
jgi:hypothetical protein